MLQQKMTTMCTLLSRVLGTWALDAAETRGSFCHVFITWLVANLGQLLKIIVKLSTQTQKQFYVYYIIHKDKDLDSNIKSENESDDKSMTCILVVELW